METQGTGARGHRPKNRWDSVAVDGDYPSLGQYFDELPRALPSQLTIVGGGELFAGAEQVPQRDVDAQFPVEIGGQA